MTWLNKLYTPGEYNALTPHIFWDGKYHEWGGLALPYPENAPDWETIQSPPVPKSKGQTKRICRKCGRLKLDKGFGLCSGCRNMLVRKKQLDLWRD